MLLTVDEVLPLLPNADPTALALDIADVEAHAMAAAPCLEMLTDARKIAQAKAILRRAVVRWHRDTIVTEQENAGPMGYSTTYTPVQKGGVGRLYDSELRELRELCGTAVPKARRAFSVRPQ